MALSQIARNVIRSYALGVVVAEVVLVVGFLVGQALRAYASVSAGTDGLRRRRLPGMLRHDFRRTAVPNMVNRRIPERVAMPSTGHKTRALSTATTS